MRRKPFLSLVLALALVGGMLALFPTPWMALALALVGLVTVQVIVVRRNLYRVPAGSSQGAEPLDLAATALARGAAEAGRTAAAGSATGTSGGLPATAATQGAPQAPAASPTPADARNAGQIKIDTELFSRFRRHLEQAESQARGEPTAAPPALEDTAVEDRVNLSSRVRPPAAAKPPGPPRAPDPPAARRKAPAAADPEEDDLFADLRPAPQPTPPPTPAPPSAAVPGERPAGLRAGRADRAEAAAAGDRPAQASPANAATPRAAPPASTGAASGDEVSAALAGDARDTASGASNLAAEAEALLRMAEEAAGREDWEALRAGVGNYTAHLAESPKLVHWRARRLQARLAVHDRDANRALQGFEDMLAAGYRPTVEDTPALLDGLLKDADAAAAGSLRVSVLVRILAGFRQARDQHAMDQCYGWIEEAQEQVGDERRLLQYLKNHLEIRKMLGDLPGQLELIDQLGNRCYRLGLTEDAKVYYEMGLRLRAEAERSGERMPPPLPEAGTATDAGVGSATVAGADTVAGAESSRDRPDEPPDEPPDQRPAAKPGGNGPTEAGEG